LSCDSITPFPWALKYWKIRGERERERERSVLVDVERYMDWRRKR